MSDLFSRHETWPSELCEKVKWGQLRLVGQIWSSVHEKREDVNDICQLVNDKLDFFSDILLRDQRSFKWAKNKDLGSMEWFPNLGTKKMWKRFY